MNEHEIKTVTRTCITCDHEPNWKYFEPSSHVRGGQCRNNWYGGLSYRDITLDGQVAAHDDKTITDCPAWKPKTV